jgi:hypothetical protein
MDFPVIPILLLRPIEIGPIFPISKPPWNFSHSVVESQRLVHRVTPHYQETPLGPTNPPLIYIAEESLGIRRFCFSQNSRYSYRHSHFCPLHQTLRFRFTANKTLPYQRLRALYLRQRA